MTSRTCNRAERERFVELETDHLEEAAARYVAAFGDDPWNEDWSLETARTRLAELLEMPRFVGYGLVVAEGETDALVAVAMGHATTWSTGSEYELVEFYVAPGWQGRGYGSRLLAHLESRLADRGVRSIRLSTARDGPTRTFYERQGYASKPEFWMEKRLDSNTGETE